MPKSRKILSAAIKKLNIDQPFNLKSEEGIGLKPKKTLVKTQPNHNEVPQYEAPRTEHPQVEGSQNGVPQSEQTQNQVAQTETTQIENPSIEVAQPECTQHKSPQNEVTRNEATQNKATQNKPLQSEHAQKKVGQSEASRFEGSQNEGRTEQSISADGYFRLAHSVFLDERVQKLSGDGFRLYIWLCSRAWRFSDSDGKVRASVSFIAMCAGMTEATISRCLKSLKELKLIELWQKDFKRGNIWRVHCDTVWKRPSKKKNKGKSAQNEAPQIKDAQAVDAGSSVCRGSPLNLKEEHPQNEDHSTLPNKSNTLSQSISPKIRKYLDSLKPESKRNSERERFLELSRDYSSEQLEKALTWILNRGDLGSGKTVHSPLAYLSKAIAQVLSEVEAYEQKKIKIAEQRQREELEKQHEAEKEREDLEFRRTAELAFAQAFPSLEEQTQVVEKIISEKFEAFSPPKNLARQIAIGAWFEKHQSAFVRK